MRLSRIHGKAPASRANGRGRRRQQIACRCAESRPPTGFHLPPVVRSLIRHTASFRRLRSPACDTTARRMFSPYCARSCGSQARSRARPHRARGAHCRGSVAPGPAVARCRPCFPLLQRSNARRARRGRGGLTGLPRGPSGGRDGSDIVEYRWQRSGGSPGALCVVALRAPSRGGPRSSRVRRVRPCPLSLTASGRIEHRSEHGKGADSARYRQANRFPTN